MVENDTHLKEFRSPDGRFSYRHHLGDDGIVYSTSSGYEDEESALKVAALLKETYSEIGRRYQLCIDLSELQEMTTEARKVWNDFTTGAQSVLDKVGLYGGSFFMRSLINFYARLGKLPIRVFKTRDEAVSWLKKG